MITVILITMILILVVVAYLVVLISGISNDMMDRILEAEDEDEHNYLSPKINKMEALKVRNTGNVAFVQITKELLESLELNPGDQIGACFQYKEKTYVCGLHDYKEAIYLNLPVFGDDSTTKQIDGLKPKQEFFMWVKKNGVYHWLKAELIRINISMVQARPFYTAANFKFYPMMFYRVNTLKIDPVLWDIEILNQL